MTFPFVDRPGCSNRARMWLEAGALAGFILTVCLAGRFLVMEVIR